MNGAEIQGYCYGAGGGGAPGGRETPRVAESSAAGGACRFFHDSVPPSKQSRLGNPPPNNVQRSPVQSTLSPRSAVLVFRHTLGFAVAEARMQTNANGHREAAQPGSTHVAQDDPHVAPARRPPPRRPRFFKGRPAAQTPLVPLWHGARGRRGLHGVGTESAARTCCFECVGPARAAPASSQKRFEGVALKLHQDSRRRRRARRTVAPADGVITCKK